MNATTSFCSKQTVHHPGHDIRFPANLASSCFAGTIPRPTFAHKHLLLVYALRLVIVRLSCLSVSILIAGLRLFLCFTLLEHSGEFDVPEVF